MADRVSHDDGIDTDDCCSNGFKETTFSSISVCLFCSSCDCVCDSSSGTPFSMEKEENGVGKAGEDELDNHPVCVGSGVSDWNSDLFCQCVSAY